MCENNQNNGDLSKDLRKVLKAGVGALSAALEKGASVIEDLTNPESETNRKASLLYDKLAQKGETALEQGRAFGHEIKDKVMEAVQNVPVSVETIVHNIAQLTDEELQKVGNLVADELGARADALKKQNAQCGCTCSGEEDPASGDACTCDEACACEEAQDDQQP